MTRERSLPETKQAPRDPSPGAIRIVRLGQGANCSSIGSVVDLVFASAVVAGAVATAIAAALADEAVRVVGGPKGDDSAGASTSTGGEELGDEAR